MSQITRWAWVPAIVFTLGAGAVHGGVRDQVSMPLRAALDETIPRTMLGFAAQDITISDEERRVAGMSNYVMRVYAPAAAAASSAAFSVYVGYYDRQQQGKTIHSPKNCLPGAGWEPLTSSEETVRTAQGVIPVNRYLLQRGKEQSVVLYWYQGRGRVAANEYQVKWDLLRDQALQGRSDEALVRIIVPVTSDEEAAMKVAREVAAQLVPSVDRALPS